MKVTGENKPEHEVGNPHESMESLIRE